MKSHILSVQYKNEARDVSSKPNFYDLTLTIREIFPNISGTEEIIVEAKKSKVNDNNNDPLLGTIDNDDKFLNLVSQHSDNLILFVNTTKDNELENLTIQLDEISKTMKIQTIKELRSARKVTSNDEKKENVIEDVEMVDTKPKNDVNVQPDNTKEQVEAPKVETEAPKVVIQTDNSIKGWGKGMGYGHQNDCDDWGVSDWHTGRIQNDARIITVINNIITSIKKSNSSNALSFTLQSSCLPLLFSELLQPGAIFDMTLHHELYKKLFELLMLISEQKYAMYLLKYDIEIPLRSSINLWEIVKALRDQSKRINDMSNSKLKDLANPQENQDTEKSEMDRIIEAIGTLYNYIENKLGSKDSVPDDVNMDEKEEEKKNYVTTMEELRFKSLPVFSTHKFRSTAKQDALPTKSLIRRLATEFADLALSLPITDESSVFVRVNEDNMQLVKFLIIPCDDTPYASGCFVFDAYFPSNYPSVPPKVNLMTTGHNSVRFNPNLYEDGYVCLSLLGTWSGQTDGEHWQPNVSTFLQVAISVQSLVFVPEPYWNEPGYEQNMSDSGQQQCCEDYSSNIRYQTVTWAMIDMLRNPPKEFRDVVIRHFSLQRDRVLKNAKKWLGETSPEVEELTKLLNGVDQLDIHCDITIEDGIVDAVNPVVDVDVVNPVVDIVNPVVDDLATKTPPLLPQEQEQVQVKPLSSEAK